MSFSEGVNAAITLMEYDLEGSPNTGRWLFDYAMGRYAAARDYGREFPEEHKQALAVLLREMPVMQRPHVLSQEWFKPHGNAPDDMRDDVNDYSCWISRKGLVYRVGFAGHGGFCAALGVKQRQLERAGWLHVSDGRMDMLYPLSSGQKRAIQKLRDLGARLHERYVDELEPIVTDDEAANKYDKVPRPGFDVVDFMNGGTGRKGPDVPFEERTITIEPMYP